MLWLIPAGLLVGTFALVSRKARAGSADPDDARRDRVLDPPPPTAAQYQNIRVLATLAGTPPEWSDFFMLVARGESGGQPLVGLGTRVGAPPWANVKAGSAVADKEAAAARAVYNSGIKTVDDCPWDADAYCFGSGGLFGMLPMSGLRAFAGNKALHCMHPWSVFDPKVSMIMASHLAYRLTQRKGWDGTVASLRRGWGLPSGMAKVPADKLAKWTGQAESVGLPASFLQSKLPPWKPLDASTQFSAMMIDEAWLPEQKAS